MILHIHNTSIEPSIREENDGYNKLFIKKIGCDDFTINASILHGNDWEKKGYNGFQTVWLKNLDRLMNFLLEKHIDIEKYRLLDLGSGIGISTMYLGENYKFKSLAGLEIDNELNKISKSNLLKRNNKLSSKKNLDIEFKLDDATKYYMLDDKYIIFMFNSLEWKALKLFIDNNYQILSKNKCILLQANDNCINQVINHAKLIKRNEYYNISAVMF